MQYISLTSRRLDQAALERVLATNLGKEARHTMKTWGQQLFDRGRREGRAEGRQEARQESLSGQREMLLSLLRARFGEPSNELRQRIESARSRQLILWAQRVLTAKTTDDVFVR
jgi:predicted transposase YdaD